MSQIQTSAKSNFSPSVGIVIEFNNVKFSNIARASCMLQILAEQLDAAQELISSVLVIFVFDSKVVSPFIINDFISHFQGHCKREVIIKSVATQNLGYYQQKNVGASFVKQEITVFIDCDVIPDDGWLSSLIAPMSNTSVDVVSGLTYVKPIGWYCSAFSLFWFFRQKTNSRGLIRTSRFHANNVAFRSEVFQTYTFPNYGTFRAECIVLSNQLNFDHRILLQQTDATVAHPPPYGFNYFVYRAFQKGRDWFLTQQLNESPPPRWREIFVCFSNNMKHSNASISQHGQEFGLTKIKRFAAQALAFGYFAIQSLGSLVSMWRDDRLSARKVDSQKSI